NGFDTASGTRAVGTGQGKTTGGEANWEEPGASESVAAGGGEESGGGGAGCGDRLGANRAAVARVLIGWLRNWAELVSMSGMDTSSPNKWKYLGPKPGSAYKQLFIKGTRIMARVIGATSHDDENRRTPEEIASDYNLPVEAVREAIAYCDSKPPEIEEDWQRE